MVGPIAPSPKDLSAIADFADAKKKKRGHRDILSDTEVSHVCFEAKI